MIDNKEIKDIFINLDLIEDYNFVEEDLLKLANAYIDAVKKPIALEERQACVDVANAYNHLVADKITEVRKNETGF